MNYTYTFLIPDCPPIVLDDLLTSGTRIEFEESSRFCGYRSTLSDELCITQNRNFELYNKLVELRSDPLTKCSPICIEIRKGEKLVFTGAFTMAEAGTEKGAFNIQPKSKDAYSCLIDDGNGEVKVNFSTCPIVEVELNLPDITAYPLGQLPTVGQFQLQGFTANALEVFIPAGTTFSEIAVGYPNQQPPTELCSSYTFVDANVNGQGFNDVYSLCPFNWWVASTGFEFLETITTADGTFDVFQVRTTWYREAFYTAVGDTPSGCGWIESETFGNVVEWVRCPVCEVEPLDLFPKSEIAKAEEKGNQSEGDILQYLQANGIAAPTSYKNGRLFSDILQKVVNELCGNIEIKSAFLGINDDGIQVPNNKAYESAAQVLHNFTLHNLGDVVRPDASTLSSGLMSICWEEIECFIKTFNGCYWIEESGGVKCLRIEGVSHPDTMKILTATKSITTSSSTSFVGNVPTSEKFAWSSGATDCFPTGEISYLNQCATEDPDELTSCIDVDIATITGCDDGTYDLDARSFVGIPTVVDQNGDYQTDGLNNCMDWDNVLRCFFMDCRYLPEGQINGEPVEFDSFKPLAVLNDSVCLLGVCEVPARSTFVDVGGRFGLARIIAGTLTVKNCELEAELSVDC